MNTNTEVVPNHLVWAILSTLLCCLPLGIVSIVYAAKVDGLRLAGDIAGAREMSEKAKMWAIYAAGASIVAIALYFLFVFGMVGLGTLGSASSY